MDGISLGPRVQAVPDGASAEEVSKEYDLMSFAILSHSQCPVLTRRGKNKSPSSNLIIKK